MVTRPIQQPLLPGLRIVCKRFSFMQYIIADNALTRMQPVPENIG
jgi:hypothetical protein